MTSCPNIGFSLELDTRRLTNGLNTIGVVLVDSGGATAVLPDPRPNSLGLSVVVEN